MWRSSARASSAGRKLCAATLRPGSSLRRAGRTDGVGDETRYPPMFRSRCPDVASSMSARRLSVSGESKRTISGSACSPDETSTDRRGQTDHAPGRSRKPVSLGTASSRCPADWVRNNSRRVSPDADGLQGKIVMSTDRLSRLTRFIFRMIARPARSGSDSRRPRTTFGRACSSASLAGSHDIVPIGQT